MRTIFYILLCWCIPALTLAAEDLKVQADKAYEEEHYAQAAEIYEELLKSGQHAAIYYNLGNCYYRLEKVGPAVLNYERALLLDPGDAAIRHNLDLARSKTLDKITPLGEVFLVTWYKAVVSLFSTDGWAGIALGTFILFLVALSVYLFSNRMLYRKIGFVVAAAALVVCLLTNLFAYQQKRVLELRNQAVVMVSATNVKSTPSATGTDLFVLHEGTKVQVTDNSMKGWKEIRLSDGKTGWIETNSIEFI